MIARARCARSRGRLPRLERRVGLERRVIRDRDPPSAREHLPGRPRLVPAGDRHREDRARRRLAASRNAPSLNRSTRPVLVRSASGKIITHVACREQPHGLAHGRRIGRIDPDGKRPEPPDHPAEDRDLEQPVPGHVVDASPHRDRDERRVGVGLMVRRDDQRAARRECCAGPTARDRSTRGRDGGIRVGPDRAAACARRSRLHKERGRIAPAPLAVRLTVSESVLSRRRPSRARPRPGTNWRPWRSIRSWHRTHVVTSGSA